MKQLSLHDPKQLCASSASTPDVALEAIGRGILMSLDQTSRIYRDSPPEATIGTLLRLAITPDVEAGRLELLLREHVVLPTTPPAAVELDLVLRVPSTGAACVISVEGHAWHRLTIEGHDAEIRRDRQIRRYYPVLRYAAREALANPWAVVLDVFAHLRTWPGFEGVELDPAMQALFGACASGANGHAPDADHTSHPATAPEPQPVINCARSRLAGLAPPPPTKDPAVLLIREGYPRHFAFWEGAEVEVLRDLFYARVDLDEIAGLLGRTRPATWAQLRRMGMVRG